MAAPSEPFWVATPPNAFDIATAWFPERNSIPPGPKLRPSLVIAVLQNKISGSIACKIAYGTKNLKLTQRGQLDLIIQNSVDMALFGLSTATRFDLDFTATVPWNNKYFGCWYGYSSPVIGSLTEHYIRDFAFITLRRNSK